MRFRASVAVWTTLTSELSVSFRSWGIWLTSIGCSPAALGSENPNLILGKRGAKRKTEKKSVENSCAGKNDSVYVSLKVRRENLEWKLCAGKNDSALVSVTAIWKRKPFKNGNNRYRTPYICNINNASSLDPFRWNQYTGKESSQRNCLDPWALATTLATFPSCTDPSVLYSSPLLLNSGA